MRVGELHAILSLDDSEFNSKLRSSGTRFQQFGNTLKRGMAGTAKAFTAATVGLAGLGLAAGKVGFAYNKLQQNSRAALDTIMGSSEAAARQMEKLDKFASTSPFGKDIFITAQQQLLAFGMEAERVIPTMDAVQQAVAAAGGSGQDLSEVVFVLAQIQAAGKITGQDLMQLGQRGINAAELIGEQMGLTGAEIREKISAGALSADDALKALADGMSTRFAGATDKLKEQWTGAADRIKASWRDLGALFARPLIDPKGGGWIVIWGNQVADILVSIRKKAEPLLALALHKFGPALQGITKHLTKLRQRIDAIDVTRVAEGFGEIAKYGPLIASAAGAMLAFGASSIPVLGRFVGVVNPAAAGLAALVATHPGLREVAGTLASEFGRALPILADIARAAGDAAGPVIDALVPGLMALAETAPGVARILAALITPAIETVGTVAKPVAETISLMAEAVTAIPEPVLAAAAAMVVLSKAYRALMGLKVVQSVIEGVQRAVDYSRVHAHLGQTSQAMGAISWAANGARGAVSQLGGAMKTAFISNPIGLAIGAISTALAIFIQKKQEARRRTDELAAALRESNGVMDENAEKIIANQLAESGAIEIYKKLGGETKELMDYLTATGDAADKAWEKISGRGHEKDNLVTNPRTGFKQASMEYHELESVMRGLRNSTDAAREKFQLQKEAQAAVTAETKSQTEALKELADQTRDAANAAMEAERAASAWMQGIDDHADALKRVQELEQEHGRAVNATADAFELANAAGREAQDIMQQRISAGAAMIDTMREEGASTDELRAKRREVVDVLTQEATQFGLNEQAARAYVERLLGIPEEVPSKIALDVIEAFEDLENLRVEINRADGTVTINGNPIPANMTLAELIGDVDEADGTVTINGDKVPGETELIDFVRNIAEQEEAVKIKGDTSPATGDVQSFEAWVRGTPVTANVNANTWQARAAIDGLNGRTITVSMIAKKVGNWLGMSHGGVIDYMADGGVREHHVAQIAPAGAWRVWAEPETGGEAYIPLAAAKRARSLEVMHEVAERFGHMMIPRNTVAYAHGGINQQAAPPGGATPGGERPIEVTNNFINPLPVPVSQAKSQADRELALAAQL